MTFNLSQTVNKKFVGLGLKAYFQYRRLPFIKIYRVTPGQQESGSFYLLFQQNYAENFRYFKKILELFPTALSPPKLLNGFCGRSHRAVNSGNR